MVIKKRRYAKRSALKAPLKKRRKRRFGPLRGTKRLVRVPIRTWGERAYAAGLAASSSSPATEEIMRTGDFDLHQHVNLCWSQWYQSIKPLPWPLYHATASQFIEGYCHHSQWYGNKWVLIPTEQKVSVIVSVMNEKETILSVIEQLQRLPLHETIFVVNGSSDESFELIRNHSQAMIIHYHQALGHDVGRAIGAKLAESDILLFLDGDFPIFAEHLVPFIHATAQGMDVALNNISPYIERFSERDDVTIVKEFVNQSMARADLRANSLTAVPHSLSKQAAQQIGYTNLAVPPKAQVIAIYKGLTIGSPGSVDVITRNRQRARNVGQNNKVADLIIGDHIEALKSVLDLNGARMSFPDQIRLRPQS